MLLKEKKWNFDLTCLSLIKINLQILNKYILSQIMREQIYNLDKIIKTSSIKKSEITIQVIAFQKVWMYEQNFCISSVF